MWKDFFDRNTLLGVALIFVMVGGYFYMTKKKIESQQKEEQLRQKFQKPTTSDSSKSTATINTPAPVVSALKLSDSTASANTPTIVRGEDIILENEVVRVTINALGGKIHDIQLKKYTSYTEKPLTLLSDSFTDWNFAFQTQAGVLSSQNTSFSVQKKSDTGLDLVAANGLQVHYTLAPNSYKLTQKWDVPNIQNSAAHKLTIQTRMNRGEVNLERERLYSTIYYLPQGQDLAQSLDKSKNEEKIESQPLSWVSFGQQFFNFSMVPSAGISNATLNSYYMTDDQQYVKKYKLEATLAPSDKLTMEYYMGPSDYKMLKSMGKDLELIVPLSQDFILFRWMKIFNIYLIIPMFDFLSKFFSNYGIIILIMTLLIKIITAPLQYKTYKSGVAMKILKPDIEKLRAKIGDDQQKFAIEQQKLFSQAGVNPFGGCLPMLLQMPILFAMFSFFPSSIDLRHQPFLWANDLSTYDSILNLSFHIPLYGSHVSLFTILTAVTQLGTTLYSQRLQPSSGPQAEQMKIMAYMMPVVFLFMFNSFPAALTYYYFLQNILSVIQQWIFTTFIIKEDVVRAEMEATRKNPKKPSGFQAKMQEMMAQAEEQKRLQQKQNKK